MGIEMFDGFESYASLSAVVSPLSYTLDQSPTIITSSDGTVTPRNSLACIKMESSRGHTGGHSSGYSSASLTVAARAYAHYPKIGISTTSHTSGTLGFAYFAHVPTNGGYGPFTPIAAVCDTDGKPHFFICVNASRQIEIRKWTPSASTATGETTDATAYTWNSDPNTTAGKQSAHSSTGMYGGCASSYTRWNHWITEELRVSHSSCTNVTIHPVSKPLDSSLFVLKGTSSGNTLTADAWNYIEIQYDVHTSSGAIKVKINRNASDTTYDMNISSQDLTDQSANNVGVIALGTFWSHKSDGTSWHSNYSTAWPTYFDDVYIIDRSSGTLGTSNWLGDVSCRKALYDTESSNTADTGAMTDINAAFNGTNDLTSMVKFAATSETLQVKSAGTGATAVPNVSSPDSIVGVRMFMYGYDTLTNTITAAQTLSGNTHSDTGLDLANDDSNGDVIFGTFRTTDPAGAAWTSSNIRSTTFKHTLA